MAADWVCSAERTVVFTGAGMSTESGIPDFRSPGGIWDRFDPAEFTFQNFIGSEEGRRRYWELGRMVYPVLRGAEPNPGHFAVAKLWQLGRLDCVITQNIEAGVSVPTCDPPCGGVIKPRIIMFGEAMPSEATEEAERRSRAAALFIVVGSSLVVYPAAHMPVHAKRAGARLVIVNRTPTPQDAEADLLIPGSAAEALAGIAERVEVRAETLLTSRRRGERRRGEC